MSLAADVNMAVPVEAFKRLGLLWADSTALAISSFCVLPLLVVWLTDHPERVCTDEICEPSLLSFRVHFALNVIGFFSKFGLVTTMCLFTEVAMTIQHGAAWVGHRPLVLLMIAYTGASHFLYGLHALACGFLPDRLVRVRDFLRMGLGGLMSQSERSAIQAVAFVEHKLMDVTMHLAGVLALGYGRPLPLRTAHLVMFITHIARYFNKPVAFFERTKVPLGRTSLNLGDVIDVVAHSATAFVLLGRQGFLGAILLSEGLRAILEVDYEKRTYGAAAA